IDHDVESPVGRIETVVADDERRLEIHVPAEKLPRLIPEELDGMRVSGAHEAEDVAAIPDVVERRSAADPVLEVALARATFHQPAAASRLAVDPVAAFPLAGVVVRPAPADVPLVAAAEQDSVAGAEVRRHASPPGVRAASTRPADANPPSQSATDARR